MKLLLDFVEPHGLMLIALLVITVLLWRAKQRRFALGVGAVWLGATFLLCTSFSGWLLSTLERPWPPVKLDELDTVDAIVVLGGGFEPSKVEPTGVHLKHGSDRVFCALELARLGKTRGLVLGGGGFRFHGERGCEADALKAWIESARLTTVPVHSLGICSDTHDEALRTAALAAREKWQRMALVTSATHMSRARGTFEKVGVRVIPVPCNYASPQARLEDTPWLKTPDLSGYGYFEGWMHEVIGTLAYRLRGWL